MAYSFQQNPHSWVFIKSQQHIKSQIHSLTHSCYNLSLLLQWSYHTHPKAAATKGQNFNSRQVQITAKFWQTWKPFLPAILLEEQWCWHLNNYYNLVNLVISSLALPPKDMPSLLGLFLILGPLEKGKIVWQFLSGRKQQTKSYKNFSNLMNYVGGMISFVLFQN